jgi:hypothetical protein
MAHFICKIVEENQLWYFEWSTVVDAPITFGMSLEEFKKYYKEEYGRKGMDDLEQRLERVEEKGTSSRIHKSVDDLIDYNRAGQRGSSLSRQQLIDVYCTQIIPENERPMGTFFDD